MSQWTTLPMAKKQVGIPQDDCSLDDSMTRWLRVAEALCLRYLQSMTYTPEDFDSRTAELIRGEMYVQFAECWRFRGDDTDGEIPQSRIPGAPSPQVERGLYSLRPPSLA